MNVTDAKRILKEGCEILESLGITYWLSAGTALGAYRDGFSDEFIQRDTDLDVGVLSDKNLYDIVPAFEAQGYVRGRIYETHGIWSQCLMVKDDIYFDIYFFNKAGKQAVNFNEHGMMKKPYRFLENMDTVEIEGKKYPVPSPIEEYLEVRYGDWKTPATEKRPWQEEAANLVSL